MHDPRLIPLKTMTSDILKVSCRGPRKLYLGGGGAQSWGPTFKAWRTGLGMSGGRRSHPSLPPLWLVPSRHTSFLSDAALRGGASS